MTDNGYATKDALVDSDWALAHLNDPNVRFVEVDVDTTAYEQSHIPGAVAWNWTSQLADGIRRDIAGREDFGALLSSSGIGPDTTIVLYGDNNNWFAAWAYWQLKLYGHRDARILNGGRKYWLDNGLALSVDEPSYAATGYPLPEPDFSLRAFRDDILPRLGDPGLALVDVRSPAEFNGEIIAPPGMSETAQRAGHIPGAASIPWAQTVKEDGTFKDAEDLATLYEAKGITPDKDIIAYCRIGERSSHSWFVLHELLGYKRVRNYDGSWTEYGSLIGVPIEKPAPVTAGGGKRPENKGRLGRGSVENQMASVPRIPRIKVVNDRRSRGSTDAAVTDPVHDQRRRRAAGDVRSARPRASPRDRRGGARRVAARRRRGTDAS